MADTNFIVSLANSARFVNNNGAATSFDNTLAADEAFWGKRNINHCQMYTGKGGIFVQVKAELDATLVLTKIYADGSRGTEVATDTTTYSTFKIVDYIVSKSNGDEFYIDLASETSSWTSEWIYVEEDLTGYLHLEWYNYGAGTTNNNNFQFDYSTTTAQANVNEMYVKANLFDYKPGGEAVVYDNMDEMVKLRQNLYRVLTFKSTNIPRWMAEKITIAMSSDMFTINGVQFTVQELPSVEPFASTNNVSLTAELTQTAILGLNTDDVGFDCDSTGTDMKIDNKVAEGATASGSFTILSGYNITQILAFANSGSGTLKMGTTIGGDEVMYATTIASGDPIYLASNRYTPSASGAWTLYYTISGVVNMDIRVQTIDNTTV